MRQVCSYGECVVFNSYNRQCDVSRASIEPMSSAALPSRGCLGVGAPSRFAVAIPERALEHGVSVEVTRTSIEGSVVAI
jgi:hypothetical protein